MTCISRAPSLSASKRRRSVSVSQSTTAAAYTSDCCVRSAALELLGRHVRELPFELPLARRLQPARAFATPKSRTCAMPSVPDEHVLRRDVAVDDAERHALLALRLVRRVEPVENAARGG